MRQHEIQVRHSADVKRRELAWMSKILKAESACGRACIGHFALDSAERPPSQGAASHAYQLASDLGDGTATDHRFRDAFASLIHALKYGYRQPTRTAGRDRRAFLECAIEWWYRSKKKRSIIMNLRRKRRFSALCVL